MKPVKLTMSAFGPYAHKQVLDFTCLGNHTLFLICGPTGAGKSTILDAMCYALYGRTSGDVRTGENMRSSYAGLEEETFVEFDFALGGKYYRVHRSPAQLARRKRGPSDKPVEKAGKAVFSEIDDKGNVVRQIASKGVEQRVEELIGIGVEQFRQIILLPQGDFRRLLLADSTERQDIMQELFGTMRYGLIENRLREEVSQLKGQAEQAHSQVQTLLASRHAENRGQLQLMMDEAGKKIKQLEEEQKKKERENEEFIRHHNEASRLAESFSRLEQAVKRAQELNKQEGEMAQKRADLKKIDAAIALNGDREALVTLYMNRKTKENDLARAEKEQKEARDGWENAEKQFEQLEQERPQQQARINRLAALEALKPDVDSFISASQSYEKVSGQLTNLEKTLKERTDRQEAVEKTAVTARKVEHALTESFIRGQASFLAEGLQDGMPCPVCGSLHHPEPAVSAENQVTREDVDKARTAAEQAEKTAGDGRKHLQEFKEKEYMPLRDKANKAKNLLEELGRKVDKTYRTPGVLNLEIGKLSKAITDFDNRSRTADTARQEQKIQLEKQNTTVLEIRKNLESLSRDYQQGLQTFTEKVRAQGFQSLEEQKRYHDRIGEKDSLTQELESHGADRKMQAETENKEKTFIGDRSKPDMEQWNSRNRQITEEIKALASQKGTLEEQEKAQKEAAEQIDALTASGAELDRTYRVVGGLYDVIRGQETGINLERFVLGALLDDVTRKANIRLSVMSGGRYQLQRALGERADARKKAGLDLEVMDSYTGKARPASTLSGGETFLASLSLALGLADVVQEYAGGVRLDSMFIDEGFGSLDQETLDLALKTLAGLQGQNRLIGIISHVSELEERITTRLRVDRTKKGSVAVFEVE